MTDRGPTSDSVISRFFGAEIRVWRGEAPLRSVFWGYGVAASSAVAVLFVTAIDQRQVALQQVLIIASALYTLWFVVGVWQCAANAAPFWGNLARLLSVAWAMNVALVLMFLQIDLLVQFMQH